MLLCSFWYLSLNAWNVPPLKPNAGLSGLPATSLLGFDPDGLGIHKCMRPEMGEFPAVAAVLDASDRDTRIRCRNAIDEDTAGVQVACHLARQIDIFGPYVPAQPELTCIRSFDSCINVSTRVIAATGPNVSSSNAGIPCVTPVSTVGM